MWGMWVDVGVFERPPYKFGTLLGTITKEGRWEMWVDVGVL